MSNTTAVTVGLDVNARSVRLAALRDDELLEECTLPYDHAAIDTTSPSSACATASSYRDNPGGSGA
jgi:hypothetical protein